MIRNNKRAKEWINMPDVTFRFEDGNAVIVSAAKGSNLLETARNATVVIDAPCSGNGACG